jgi:hypothetical protein
VRKRRADPVTCVEEQIKVGLLHARQIQWSSPLDPVELKEKSGSYTPLPGAQTRGRVEPPRRRRVRELEAASGRHHRRAPPPRSTPRTPPWGRERRVVVGGDTGGEGEARVRGGV